jgi:putative ABC transport system substrate-binding protein
MVRRAPLTFYLGLCCILISGAWPAKAQQAGKVYRIGILGAGTAAQNATRMDAFRRGLRELGWVAERNVTFDERWADGHYERLPALAGQLVALKVDLILASGGTPAAEAALKTTQRIPIVVGAISDPLATKIVPSLAHPGGNVTGITNMASELYPKRLALLKEGLPGVKHVALLLNGANPFSPEALRLSQATARSLGIELEAFDVRDPKDLEGTFARISNAGVQAVLVGTDITLLGSVKQLGGLALKHKLPLIAGNHDVGVLVAYSVDNDESYRRAATYVDKILKGAKAGDLPVEQPTKFSLIIDLGTARALGLTFPQSLLVRADEVIQ